MKSCVVRILIQSVEFQVIFFLVVLAVYQVAARPQYPFGYPQRKFVRLFKVTCTLGLVEKIDFS